MSTFTPGNNPFTRNDNGFSSQPFNNPSAHPELVAMWRSAILKARQQEIEQKKPQDQVCALIMNFDGAGAPLVVGMGGIPQVPPGSFRIIGIKLAAGVWSSTQLKIIPVAATCSVDISLASVDSWSAGSRPMYFVRPSLVNQAEIAIDPLTWLITDIQPGDMIPFTLVTFSGQATVLTVTLSLRRIDVTGVGAPTLTDETGTTFTDANGLPYFSRGTGF